MSRPACLIASGAPLLLTSCAPNAESIQASASFDLWGFDAPWDVRVQVEGTVDPPQAYIVNVTSARQKGGQVAEGESFTFSLTSSDVDLTRPILVSAGGISTEVPFPIPRIMARPGCEPDPDAWHTITFPDGETLENGFCGKLLLVGASSATLDGQALQSSGLSIYEVDVRQRMQASMLALPREAFLLRGGQPVDSAYEQTVEFVDLAGARGSLGWKVDPHKEKATPPELQKMLGRRLRDGGPIGDPPADDPGVSVFVGGIDPAAGTWSVAQDIDAFMRHRSVGEKVQVTTCSYVGIDPVPITSQSLEVEVVSTRTGKVLHSLTVPPARSANCPETLTTPSGDASMTREPVEAAIRAVRKAMPSIRTAVQAEG